MKSEGSFIRTNRKIDMAAEAELAKFMNHFFYERLTPKENVPISFSRKTDAKNQLQGIDIELDVGDKKYLIDEKAAIYYSNAMIPTFAFEIDSIQSGHDTPCIGWFVNSELRTDYYMLIWPNVKCVQMKSDEEWVRKPLKRLKEDDYTIVEAMLIKKKNIVDWLGSQDWSLDRLIQYCKRFRENIADANNNCEVKISDDLTIKYSGKKAEKPINLLIKKDRLKELARATYLISRDGYGRIK